MTSLRTLIVDDDRDFAESIADLMEMLGHKPQLAYDGKRAVERFTQQHFDVVLMDVRMPEMSGIEAFKAVKSINPDAKVVLMTGYSMDQDLAEAVQAGALGVMHKPVDMRELEALLGDVKPGGAVLVVDDDQDYANSVRDALEQHGCVVKTAATGEECLALLETNGIQVVLLDMRLPGMSGREVVTRLRREGFETPVVLLTAYRDDMRTDLDALGVVAVVDKPVDVDDLLKLVQSATEV